MANKDDLIQSMLSTISRFEMIRSGDRVLVAVSGGPDSVALLHALWSIQDQTGIKLHVAHLNHSFRAEESDRDAEYVRELSSRLGVSCTVEKIDVPTVQRSLRVSPEEAARLVRYEFLERAADSVGADRIAIGHTSDDQVETVLLNLLRGTGVDGLAGMPPVRGQIVRPFIETSRAEVERYVAEQDLRPMVDSTNLQPRYTRNKIRLDLLPKLRDEYNPDIDSAILRVSELARADTAYLYVEARDALQSSTVERAEDSLTLDSASLLEYPLAVRRRVVREAVREARGGLTDLGFLHTEEILRMLRTGVPFEYELPGGTFVTGNARHLKLMAARPVESIVTFDVELPVPGRAEVAEIDLLVESTITTERLDPVQPRSGMQAMLDFASIVGTLRVRNWRPGDRIRPFGMAGHKKLQDVFVDAKIPRAVRHRIPLIADDEKVVWVPGLVLSESARVTDRTRAYVRIAVSGMPGSEFAD